MDPLVDNLADKEKPWLLINDVSPAYLAPSHTPKSAMWQPLLPVTTTTGPATPVAAAASTAAAAMATETAAAAIPPYTASRPASGASLHQN